MQLRSEQLVNVLVGALSSEPNVEGIAIGGSHGRGEATDESDVDLFILAVAGGRASIDFYLSSQIPIVLPVAVHVNRGFVAGVGYLHQFVLKGAFLLDIGIIPFEEIEQCGIQPTMKVLSERSGVLSKVVANARKYDDLTEGHRESLLKHYAGLFYVYMFGLTKSLKKAEPWSCVYYVERTRSVIFSLLRLQIRQYSPFMHKAEHKISYLSDNSIIKRLENYVVRPDLATIISSAELLLSSFADLQLSCNDSELDRLITDTLAKAKGL